MGMLVLPAAPAGQGQEDVNRGLSGVLTLTSASVLPDVKSS